MKLIIDNSQNKFEDDFLKYLLSHIKAKFVDTIDKKQLIRFQEFEDKNKAFASVLRQNVNIYDALLACIYNLKITKFKESVYIEIPDNICLHNTRTKLTTVANFIEYGNTSINPYPIFSKVFNYFVNNMYIYYDRYMSIRR